MQGFGHVYLIQFVNPCKNFTFRFFGGQNSIVLHKLSCLFKDIDRNNSIYKSSDQQYLEGVIIDNAGELVKFKQYEYEESSL